MIILEYLAYLNEKLLWVGILNTILLLLFSPHNWEFQRILLILEFGIYVPFLLVYQIPILHILTFLR
jgi:hypothetical protein